MYRKKIKLEKIVNNLIIKKTKFTCPNCNSYNVIKYGIHHSGKNYYKCNDCKKYTTKIIIN